MLMYLIVFLAFFVVLVVCMFHGFWGNILTFINMLFAGLIAVALWEPLSSWMTELKMVISDPSIAALRGDEVVEINVLPFFFLWGIFFGAFVTLRALTDYFSRFRVRFHIAVEWIGRAVSSLAVALLFLSFSTFTVHVAPLAQNEVARFSESPSTRNFLFGPDRLWMGYCRYASRNSLSEFRGGWFLPEVTGPEDPKDTGRSLRVFNSNNDFVVKHKWLRMERRPTAKRVEK